MKVRSLVLLVVPAVAALSAPRASAQACAPFPACRTIYDSANPALAAASQNGLLTLNCPCINMQGCSPNAGFHLHFQNAGFAGAPFIHVLSTGTADFPITFGATTYPVLVNPAGIILTIATVADPTGHAPGYVCIPNDATLLGTFLAVQGLFISGGSLGLTNGVSFTICSQIPCFAV